MAQTLENDEASSITPESHYSLLTILLNWFLIPATKDLDLHKCDSKNQPHLTYVTWFSK